MKEDTNTENGESENGQNSGPAAVTGERRPKGVNGGFPSPNPNYSYYLESGGHTDNSVSVHPPESESSPLDNAPSEGPFGDLTLDLPDLFKNDATSNATLPEKPSKPEKTLSPLTPTVTEPVELNDLPEPAASKPLLKLPSPKLPPKLSFKPLTKLCPEFGEDSAAHKNSSIAMYDCEKDELGICEPKRTFKLKAIKKSKNKKKSVNLPREEPLGAASSDYMSEAARAELMASEKDKLAMGEFENGDNDGDTDSLMEWWDTVEKWDEVPSNDENVALDQDESKSFSILADKVNRGLRLFNKVFTERAEVLWQSVITLRAIADNSTAFHHKAKIGGITGGTTTAVGGVTAIVGLALAPVTLGASLLVTAVGVGVATAGGIASASVAISNNVNNTKDRKKVEVVLQEDEVHLVELARILHFSNTGLYKLRGHPFLRSGTQHYSQDWEVRRAVQMISLMDGPVMKGTEFIDRAVSSLQGLFKDIDKYFMKDPRELKKGCTKEITAEIKDVANVLNDCIKELNGVREDLKEVVGEV